MLQNFLADAFAFGGVYLITMICWQLHKSYNFAISLFIISLFFYFYLTFYQRQMLLYSFF